MSDNRQDIESIKESLWDLFAWQDSVILGFYDEVLGNWKDGLLERFNETYLPRKAEEWKKELGAHYEDERDLEWDVEELEDGVRERFEGEFDETVLRLLFPDNSHHDPQPQAEDDMSAEQSAVDTDREANEDWEREQLNAWIEEVRKEWNEDTLFALHEEDATEVLDSWEDQVREEFEWDYLPNRLDELEGQREKWAEELRKQLNELEED